MTKLAVLVSSVLVASCVTAAEVKVLSAGAVEPAMAAFARLVKQQTGHDLVIQYNTTPRINERLAAGEVYDILIAPPAVIDQAAKDRKVAVDSRVTIGRVGAGVVTRTGGQLPDISTVDALKSALLAADSIVYNTASTGIYLDRLFERLGIAATLKPRTTRYPDGAGVIEHVINGKGNEIGFGAMTEIRQYEPRGARLVGPLPAEIQNYTTYDGAVMDASPAAQAAKSVLALAATPAAKTVFAAAGVD